VIVFASLVWTIYNWSGLTEIKHKLGGAIVVVAALLVSETCFLVGTVIMFVSAGSRLFGGDGIFVNVFEARRNTKFFATQVTTSTPFRIGFNLNWIGAVLTGLTLLLGILFLLPTTSWGLVILPVLDIVASFGWRIPIDRQIRALKEAP
jgi:hypothetical protein